MSSKDVIKNLLPYNQKVHIEHDLYGNNLYINGKMDNCMSCEQETVKFSIINDTPKSI